MFAKSYQSEVTVINKQKFLAELGKLLTFMYEEDRKTALALYTAMFEEAASEEALIQLLMSPTRQAVVIARAYDAAARKLQGSSKAQEGSNGEEAKFLTVIENIRAEAVSRGIIGVPGAEFEEETEETAEEPVEDENQFSLFEINDEETETETEDETENAAEAEETEAEKTEESEENVEAAVETNETESAPEVPNIIRNDEEINAFIAEFQRDTVSAVEGETAAAAEASEQTTEEAGETAAADEGEAEPTAEVETEPVTMVRKPKVFLLILYIIAAIPITIAGAAVLLIPTLILLALAIVAVAAGVTAMTAVFSGFAVIADILVVLGCALAVCAVALFLLWTFIWFTVDVLIGFVAGAFRLGGKWCYKEVPAK